MVSVTEQEITSITHEASTCSSLASHDVEFYLNPVGENDICVLKCRLYTRCLLGDFWPEDDFEESHNGDKLTLWKLRIADAG